MVNVFLMNAFFVVFGFFFDGCKAMEADKSDNEVMQYYIVPYASCKPEQPVTITTDEFKALIRWSQPIKSINQALPMLPVDTQKIIHLPAITSEGFSKIRPLISKLDKETALKSDISHHTSKDVVSFVYDALYLNIQPIHNVSTGLLVSKIKNEKSIVSLLIEQAPSPWYLAHLPENLQQEANQILFTEIDGIDEVQKFMSKLYRYRQVPSVVNDNIEQPRSFSRDGNKIIINNLTPSSQLSFDFDKPVDFLIVSPNRLFVSFFFANEEVKIFDSRSKKFIFHASGYKKDVKCLAVSENGNFSAASDTKQISIFDPKSKGSIANFTPTVAVRYLDIRNDGQLVICGDNCIQIFEFPYTRCHQEIATNSMNRVCYSNNIIIGSNLQQRKNYAWRKPLFSEKYPHSNFITTFLLHQIYTCEQIDLAQQHPLWTFIFNSLPLSIKKDLMDRKKAVFNG